MASDKFFSPGEFSNVEGFYERDARRFNIWTADVRSFEYYNETDRARRMAALLPIETKKILDLGCGDGYLSYILARKGHKVVALDISRTRLKKFETLSREYGIEQVCASALDLPFDDSTFDAVVSSEMLEHIHDFRKVLTEIYRVLVIGGILILSVPHQEKLEIYECPSCGTVFSRWGHLHSFSPQGLKYELENLGLHVEQIILFRSVFAYYLRRVLVIPRWLLAVTDWFFTWLLPRHSQYMILVARKNSGNQIGSSK